MALFSELYARGDITDFTTGVNLLRNSSLPADKRNVDMFAWNSNFWAKVYTMFYLNGRWSKVQDSFLQDYFFHEGEPTQHKSAHRHLHTNTTAIADLHLLLLHYQSELVKNVGRWNYIHEYLSLKDDFASFLTFHKYIYIQTIGKQKKEGE